MQKFSWSLVSVLLIGCTPPECTPDTPLKLSAISGLRLIPDTTSVILESGAKQRVLGSELEAYSCPTFDFTELTAKVGSAPLSATFAGGPEWNPPTVYSPYGGGGSGSGVCTCGSALMRVEGATGSAVPDQPISSRRFDVTLAQGSTLIQATYLDVSNSVQVVEVTSPDARPNQRMFQFFSGFNRPYTIAHDALNKRSTSGTNVKVVARYQGADVFFTLPSDSPTFLVLNLSGPADELTFEIERIFYDLQPSDCRGPAACEPLRVFAPKQTLKL